MLLDLVILLAVARAAAELAERVKVPAVLAEIVAGILIGPSALNLVGGGEVLHFLAELGVIVLLVSVGLEMDLGELGAVGRASLLVAVAGVALPFAGGYAVATALGQASHPAIFVGAALTATSVGITARVFGDLRALSTVEARTVLGAAVADDVLGLVILTVVVRIVQTGSVSVVGLMSVIGAAVAFLAVSGVLGVRFAPPLFRFIDRRGRSSGALLVAALAFTLALSEVASVAKLAPIIGAFVAGLSLGQAREADRIRRELTPIGHVLIPIFFVQIGIDTDIGQFVDPSVLALAGGLLVVAVLGKVAASLAAVGSPGDKWLIGLGMLPRGEVGLIFAGLGLRSGVLGESLYAALLLVVLGTTLITPPVLRWRLLRVTASRRLEPGSAEPYNGWLGVEDGVVELRGRPGSELALLLGLRAARMVADARPGDSLLDWFGRLDLGELTEPSWEASTRRELFALLREGNSRSWRFLETTGMLDAILPELAETLRRRREDASELDATQVFRWSTLESAGRILALGEVRPLDHPDWLLLAALILDVAGDREPPVEAARQIVRRLRLGVAAEQEIALLVAERNLLRAAAARPDGLDEDRLLPLAFHLLHVERTRALLALTLASEDLDPWLRTRVRAVAERIEHLLSRPDVAAHDTRNLVEQRREEALAVAPSKAVAERIAHAPRPWLLASPPEVLARQAALLEPLPPGTRVRAKVWGDRVELGCRDRRGLLAGVTGVLAEAGATIRSATTATWPDGGVVMAFDVDGPHVDADAFVVRVEEAAKRPPAARPVPDAVVVFDDDASPWYTIVDIEAPDAPGLLHAITAAVTAVGASIHSARITTDGLVAKDRFELTDRRGAKLPPATQSELRSLLGRGSNGARRRRFTLSKQLGHGAETPTP